MSNNTTAPTTTTTYNNQFFQSSVLSDNNTIITLERDTFFPANILTGSLRLSSPVSFPYNAIRICLHCRISYHYEVSDGDGGTNHIYKDVIVHKQVITLLGNEEKDTPLGGYKEDENHHEFPAAAPSAIQQNHNFAFNLPASALPSCNIKGNSADVKVQWTLNALIDCGGKIFKGKEKAFKILCPISLRQYETPSAITTRKETEVTCFDTCCTKGTVSAEIKLDKTILSIERDRSLNFTVSIDNTDGGKDIKGMEASLLMTATPKFAVSAGCCTPRKRFYPIEMPCQVKAGQKGSVTGTIRFPEPHAMINSVTHPFPASCSSALIDFKWSFCVKLHEVGCCMDDAQLNVDLVICHFVDSSSNPEIFYQARNKKKSGNSNNDDDAGECDDDYIRQLDAMYWEAIDSRTGKYEVKNLFAPTGTVLGTSGGNDDKEKDVSVVVDDEKIHQQASSGFFSRNTSV